MKRFTCKECESGPCVMRVPWTPSYCPRWQDRVTCWTPEGTAYPPKFPAVCEVGNWVFLDGQLAHITETSGGYISVVRPYSDTRQTGWIEHRYVSRKDFMSLRVQEAVPTIANTAGVRAITKYTVLDVREDYAVLRACLWTDDTILATLPDVTDPAVYKYYTRDEHEPLVTFVAGKDISNTSKEKES